MDKITIFTSYFYENIKKTKLRLKAYGHKKEFRIGY